MPKGTKGETCEAAIRAVIEPSETVTFTDLLTRVKRRGKWNNSTIWEHLMALVVNLPPARLHWPKLKPFLFLHADGRYELHQDTANQSSRNSGMTEERNLSRGQLIEHHLRLDKILDSLDSKEVPNEGFAGRVMRLRDADLLPGNIACMMLTVNGLRNIVVHEGFIMGPHEAGVVKSAMAGIEAWNKEKKAPKRQLPSRGKASR